MPGNCLPSLPLPCTIINLIVHGTTSPGPPPSTLFFAREPMFPRERQRPSDACAYPRFWKVTAQEGRPLALRNLFEKGRSAQAVSKTPDRTVGMAGRSQKLPDYFTRDEAEALVTAAPSYPTRMAFRIMLRTRPQGVRGPGTAACGPAPGPGPAAHHGTG